MTQLAEKIDYKYLEQLASGFAEQEATAFYNRTLWTKQARATQIEPRGEWSIWLILAGRGWGKTRTGAENILTYAMQRPNSICGVVAPTSGDLRRVCFEGPSGLLKLVPKECLIDTGKAYNRSAMEFRLWNG